MHTVNTSDETGPMKIDLCNSFSTAMWYIVHSMVSCYVVYRAQYGRLLCGILCTVWLAAIWYIVHSMAGCYVVYCAQYG